MEISTEELLELQDTAAQDGYQLGYEDGLTRAIVILQKNIDRLESQTTVDNNLSESHPVSTFEEFQYNPNDNSGTDDYDNYGPGMDDYEEPLTR